MQPLLYNIAGSVGAKITGTHYIFNSAVFMPISGFTAAGLPMYNNSTVYIGVESGRYAYALTTGQNISWALETKEKDSIANFWIYGTAPNGVYVQLY